MARASAEDLRAALPRISVPTLLLYGEDDVRAPRQVAEALGAAIGSSCLVFIPAAGHVCTVEAPELVSDQMRAFLQVSP